MARLRQCNYDTDEKKLVHKKLAQVADTDADMGNTQPLLQYWPMRNVKL